MVLQLFTQKQVFEALDQDDEDGTWVPNVLPTINKWLARGDGLAIYENHDLGHAGLGHKQFVSFGSEAAMLTSPDHPEWDETPPEFLPNIGNQINWRYVLIGVYRGEPLERKVEGG